MFNGLLMENPRAPMRAVYDKSFYLPFTPTRVNLAELACCKVILSQTTYRLKTKLAAGSVYNCIATFGKSQRLSTHSTR